LLIAFKLDPREVIFHDIRASGQIIIALEGSIYFPVALNQLSGGADAGLPD